VWVAVVAVPGRLSGVVLSPQSTLIEEMLAPLLGDVTFRVMVTIMPEVVVETVTAGGNPATCIL